MNARRFISRMDIKAPRNETVHHSTGRLGRRARSVSLGVFVEAAQSEFRKCCAINRARARSQLTCHSDQAATTELRGRFFLSDISREVASTLTATAGRPNARSISLSAISARNDGENLWFRKHEIQKSMISSVTSAQRSATL
jgi:hypothetical protein